MRVSQELRQGINDVDGYIATNFIHGFNNVFTLDGFTTLKDYLQVRVELHVHLVGRIVGDGCKGQYYCLRFNHPTVEGDEVTNCVLFKDVPVIAGIHIGCRAHHEQAVLVDIRDFLEHPEWVRPVLIPSMVRLQPLNECLHILMHRADLLFTRIPEELSAVITESIPIDRELRILLNIVRQRCSMVTLGKGIGQLVQSPAQVVGNIPNNYGEGVLRDRVSIDPDAIAVGSAIRVRFVKDRVTVSQLPLIECGLQVFHVMVCPMQLEGEVERHTHNEVESNHEEEAEN